jgi:TonB family protein
MKQFIKPACFAAAVALAAAFTSTANAATVTLQPLTPVIVSNVNVVRGCQAPQKDARIAGTPFFEDSLVDEAGGVSGTSGVVIGLSSTGRVTSTDLVESSGNWDLDMAALLSARTTKFSPETRNCVAIAGRYLYQIVY